VALLAWDDTLSIDHGAMDGVHREFVDLLNRLSDAEAASVLVAFDTFVAHTEAHFAQEESWMERCAFPPVHCHTRQHEGVLTVAREVRPRLAAGETELARVFAGAVAEWFRDHAASMDTMLAWFMRQSGYGELLLSDAPGPVVAAG
jgi:hemerythrin